ncbi:MAG TPA: hypothetical protein VF407_21170 [Polyangiaceae bacterium]
MRRIVKSAPFGFFCAASAIVTACSSDWSVRSFDAGAEDGSVASDAAVDGDSSTPVVDSGPPPGDGGPCDSILSDLATKKAKAITCTLGEVSDCASSLDDECGCTIFVGVQSSIAANDYAGAIDTAKSAGCTSQCSGCPAVPVRGTCVEQGASFVCSPP